MIRATANDEKYVLTDANNALGTLQNKQGDLHWTRKVPLLSLNSVSHHFCISDERSTTQRSLGNILEV
jgi:hypothetical protein